MSIEWVIQNLRQLIEIPSLSREENQTADFLENLIRKEGLEPSRSGNNVWVISPHFHPSKPSVLLNSHHDTVKPNASYSRDPWKADLIGDQLFGLGSNDAGGSLICLLATFLHFKNRTDLPFNLIWAGTAEEEISGKNGVESILPLLPPINLGIVGEPTGMDLAVSEKGLLVLDVCIFGKAGHAARQEGVNAIYEALPVLEWFRTYEFPQVSPFLGPMRMQVTQIEAGTQHNIVPDTCRFTVDVRVTDAYTLEETLSIIRSHVPGECNPRSVRLRSSRISLDHPIVQAGIQMGKNTYGSPTLSDQALMPFTTLKIGPGQSARSHTADEFILISELKSGILEYISLLENYIILLTKGSPINQTI